MNLTTESELANESPWYRTPRNTVPFALAKVISSDTPDAPPFYCTAAFPWSQDSLSTLWEGSIHDETNLANWTAAVLAYAGTVAVGSKGCLYIFPGIDASGPSCVRLRDNSLEVHCAAWALTHVPGLVASTDPLVVFTAGSLIFILNAQTRQLIGQLRGHGGPITSLCVHPTHPELFCTTSRDFTARLYDLTCRPLQAPNNMHWLPATRPSLAGPAHGLQMTEWEGDEIGQCLAVYVGGRSGGHRAAVMCAAFHRSAPLLATCGMDRTVKIWRMPPLRSGILAREDKPLFSTDYIHKARVLSIAWLSHDTLVSHCAPAPMRKRDGKIVYENGTVTIWRWLGYDRFFPPSISQGQEVMRGCASDWRGSESFKILSSYFLPMTTLTLHVHQQDGQDPLLVVPMGKGLRILNITDFGPRAIPPFPLDEEVVELTEQLQLGEPMYSTHADRSQRERTPETIRGEAADEQEGDENEPSPNIPYSTQQSREAARLKELFESVRFWQLTADKAAGRIKDIPDITACEMTFDGRIVFGVGDRGTLYVWQRTSG